MLKNRRRFLFVLFLTIAFHSELVAADETCCGSNSPMQTSSPVTPQFAYATEMETSNPPRRRRRRRPKPYKVIEVSKGGTISGTVSYKEATPEATKITIVKDHETCGKRVTSVPKIRKNDKGLVAEAVVFLADITKGKAIPKRDSPPTVDQKLCTFVPHVQAVIMKEPVEIINSDPVAHNIKADQRIFTLFNILQPQQNMKAVKTFDKPGLVSIRCNVHDWMNGYLYVLNHPYYQVTEADGAFKLEDVPPGKYELAVWQEHLGEQYFEVEVKAGETTELPVVLKPESTEPS